MPHDPILPRYQRTPPTCLACGLLVSDAIHHAPAWIVRAAEHRLPAKVAVR